MASVNLRVNFHFQASLVAFGGAVGRVDEGDVPVHGSEASTEQRLAPAMTKVGIERANTPRHASDAELVFIVVWLLAFLLPACHPSGAYRSIDRDEPYEHKTSPTRNKLTLPSMTLRPRRPPIGRPPPTPGTTVAKDTLLPPLPHPPALAGGHWLHASPAASGQVSRGKAPRKPLHRPGIDDRLPPSQINAYPTTPIALKAITYRTTDWATEREREGDGVTNERMAEPDRTSTGVDRRLSTRVSLQQDDSDEDVYALAALGMSSGGYRPNEQTASQPRGPSQPRRQTPPPRPSSISKPRYDSFALQHDGAMGTLPTRNSTVASSSSAMPSIRPSSTASEVPVIRPESPYQGPSAPSHPYQMYPQQSRLARTASVVTTSTAAVSEMSYAGPSAPTHPYGMYPQNIVPEADVQPLQPAVVIPPVGFPGRNNNYQRRIGPDGEEIGDIIGPDGHTEQLPPYTQYADEALVRKTRPNVQIPVAGAGGMGLATRNPEFASRENLNSPLSAQSIQSAAPSIMSERRLDTTPQEASEKPKELKKWQKVARRKVCGIIPIWVFVLIAVCFLLFAIILAAVFTALKPPHKDKKPQGSHDSGNSNKQPQEIEITTTTTLDAAPFTVFPTSLPTLPTGTYALPITVPSVAPSSCIVDSTQSGAWSCMIQPALPYQFSISGTLDPNPLFNNQIKLGYGNRTVDYLVYGAQPPVLYQHRSLRLVNDSQSPDRGPAWFFQMRYDKVVILPGPTLLTSTVSRRGGAKAERGRPGEYSSGFSGRKGVAQPGEKPWFCYWNGTLLEAFIYVNQTSRAGAGSGTAAASSNYPQMTTGPSYASNTNVPPSSSTSNYPPPWATGAGDPQFLPLFPKVLKLEERRIPVEDQIPPYCVQNIVNADGTFQPLLNSTGLPTTLYLNETTPLSKSTMQGKRITFADISARDYIDEQDDLLEEEPYLLEKREDNVCGCVWISQ